jgi:hypothetical protein
MTLSILQQDFARNIAHLILRIYESNYACTLGEAYRTQEQAEWNAAKGIGIKDSLHCKRLAVDLMLFKDGVWCTDGESYRPFGEYWKTLNSLNRFGGDFARKDWVHFEMQEGA